MRALIDADILLYEIGFAAETAWQHAGFPPFDFVAEMLDNRIGNICAITEAVPELYITGPTNFRYAIAKRTPYKDRPGLKPFHYKNLKAYIRGKYNVFESIGMEADDWIAIEQTRDPENTIVCTRDKDIRAVPGNHYGWELANQPQFGPLVVTNPGWIKLSEDRKKLRGVGDLFFYAQCLTGDSVDSIPGLGNRTGPVAAFKILDGCTTTQEAFKRVLEAYRGVYGDDAENELLEQGRLLHMTRYLDEWGNPVLWEIPKC